MTIPRVVLDVVSIDEQLAGLAYFCPENRHPAQRFIGACGCPVPDRLGPYVGWVQVGRLPGETFTNTRLKDDK
jgi:hypothetical protein